MSEALTGRKAARAVTEAARLGIVTSQPSGVRVGDMRSMREAGRTFAEIGKAFGVSRQRAEQIVNDGRPRRTRAKPPEPLSREQKQRLIVRVMHKSGKSLVKFAEEDLARHARTVRGYVHGEAEVPRILVLRLRGLAKLYGAVDELAEGAVSTSIHGTIVAIEP